MPVVVPATITTGAVAVVTATPGLVMVAALVIVLPGVAEPEISAV